MIRPFRATTHRRNGSIFEIPAWLSFNDMEDASMNVDRRWFSGIAVLLFSVLASVSVAFGQAAQCPVGHRIVSVQDGNFLPLDEGKAGKYAPATFKTDYVDDLAAGLAGIDPGIQTVNLSCPDQSSMLFHKKCGAGTFQCGKVCCDASGDVACVNGVCCVPPHCPR